MASMEAFRVTSSDPTEHKGSSHICQNIFDDAPGLQERYSVDWRKLDIFEGFYTVACGIKATQYRAKVDRDGFGCFAVIDGTINSV